LVGSGRGLIVRYYPGIRQDGLTKTTRKVSVAGRRGRDLNPGPPESIVVVVIVHNVHTFSSQKSRFRRIFP
jgi:hypothetical protein